MDTLTVNLSNYSNIATKYYLRAYSLFSCLDEKFRRSLVNGLPPQNLSLATPMALLSRRRHLHSFLEHITSAHLSPLIVTYSPLSHADAGGRRGIHQ